MAKLKSHVEFEGRHQVARLLRPKFFLFHSRNKVRYISRKKLLFSVRDLDLNEEILEWLSENDSLGFAARAASIAYIKI